MYKSIVVPIHDKFNVAFVLDNEKNNLFFSKINNTILSKTSYTPEQVKTISGFLSDNGLLFDEQMIVTNEIPDCYLDNKESIDSINLDNNYIFPEVLCFCEPLTL